MNYLPKFTAWVCDDGAPLSLFSSGLVYLNKRQQARAAEPEIANKAGEPTEATRYFVSSGTESWVHIRQYE